MTRILTVSLVTLGDPGRMTGGYRYHRRMAELAPACGATVRFVSFPDRRFPLPALAGRAVLRETRADVVVLRGESGRRKVVRVAGVSAARAAAALGIALGG